VSVFRVFNEFRGVNKTEIW